MTLPRLALFGTPEYSLLVFEKLRTFNYPIAVVATKPPRPIGRKQILTETPVALWAKNNKLNLILIGADPQKPWLFQNENLLTQQVLEFNPELLISADFTQKIPMQLVKQIKHGGLNVHPSLLPAYRGPAPIPWAIHNGEKQTGVSIVTLNNQLDAGLVIAQEKELILPSDTTDILLHRLFTKGADLLLKVLPEYIDNPTANRKLPTANPSYFTRLTRDHGFEPWEKIKLAIENGKDTDRIDRKWRAFHPWPGLWTKVVVNNQEKRMKILKLRLENHKLILDEIQLEGKNQLEGSAVKQLLAELQDENSS